MPEVVTGSLLFKSCEAVSGLRSDLTATSQVGQTASAATGLPGQKVSVPASPSSTAVAPGMTVRGSCPCASGGPPRMGTLSVLCKHVVAHINSQSPAFRMLRVRRLRPARRVDLPGMRVGPSRPDAASLGRRQGASVVHRTACGQCAAAMNGSDTPSKRCDPAHISVRWNRW